MKRREVCPALFNDRLSRYLVHKLNCCFTCLSIVGSALSCCGNKQTLNGVRTSLLALRVLCLDWSHSSPQSNKQMSGKRGEMLFDESCHHQVEGEVITSKHSIQVGIWAQFLSNLTH